MNGARAAWLAITLVVVLGNIALAAGADIVADVRAASDARNFALAEREIQSYRSTVGVTPDMLEALSWLARGTLDDKQYDRADAYANETRQLSLDLLKRVGKGDAPLVTALGAAIEVHAQVLAAPRWSPRWAPPSKFMRRCWQREASARRPSPTSKPRWPLGVARPLPPAFKRTSIC